MLGKYEIEITTKKINYTFLINRKITLLRGYSATGKSKLIKLIKDSITDKSVKIKSKVNISVLDDINYDILLNSKGYTNSIIFIDEDNPIYLDNKFSKYIKESDNYFVLINRSDIDSLPYSYKEIYELKYDKKSNTNYMSRIYKDYENNKIPIYNNDKVLVEDSGSGYQFYKELSKIYKFELYSANGKSNIRSKINNNDLIIADGAAFGNEIDKIDNYIKNNNVNIKLFLPESFEYLLLKIYFEDYVKDKDFSYMIDSKYYFSWEIYFEYLLKELCKNKLKINYKKENIDKYFKSYDNLKKFVDKIKNSIIFINYDNINLNWDQ